MLRYEYINKEWIVCPMARVAIVRLPPYRYC
jgi:hypothetical protein